MAEIVQNSIVRLISDPSKKGVVMAVAGSGVDAQYTVFLDNQVRQFYAEQIETCEVRSANWVTRDEFRAIICPKPLVAERKWELEMREKFDEEFTPLDGASLRQALSATDRDGHRLQEDRQRRHHRRGLGNGKRTGSSGR